MIYIYIYAIYFSLFYFHLSRIFSSYYSIFRPFYMDAVQNLSKLDNIVCYR